MSRSATPETYISRIRKKIGYDFGLKTVRGLGYYLEAKDCEPKDCEPKDCEPKDVKVSGYE